MATPPPPPPTPTTDEGDWTMVDHHWGDEWAEDETDEDRPGDDDETEETEEDVDETDDEYAYEEDDDCEDFDDEGAVPVVLFSEEECLKRAILESALECGQLLRPSETSEELVGRLAMEHDEQVAYEFASVDASKDAPDSWQVRTDAALARQLEMEWAEPQAPPQEEASWLRRRRPAERVVVVVDVEENKAHVVDDDAAPHEDEGSLAASVLEGATDKVEAILSRGADPNGSRRLPPLHFAPSGDVARCLIRYGADVELRSRLGRTPLMSAARVFCPGVVRVLLDHGADVNALANGNVTALAEAMSASPTSDGDGYGLAVVRREQTQMWRDYFLTILSLLEHGAPIPVNDDDDTVVRHFLEKIDRPTFDDPGLRGLRATTRSYVATALHLHRRAYPPPFSHYT